MTGTELHNLLYQRYNTLITNACIVTDATYRVPKDKNDFLSSLSKEWFEHKQRNEFRRYVPDKNDCDDFALQAVACVKNWVANAAPYGNTGVTFGMLHYVPSPGPHAINFFLVGEEPEIIYWEPQTGREIGMTKDEECTVHFTYC